MYFLQFFDEIWEVVVVVFDGGMIFGIESIVVDFGCGVVYCCGVMVDDIEVWLDEYDDDV